MVLSIATLLITPLTMNLQVGAEYRNYNVPSGTSEEESRKEPPKTLNPHP